MQLVYNLYMNTSGYSCSAQDYILAMLQSNPEFDIKVNFMNQTDWLGISENRKQIFKSLQKKNNITDQVTLFHSIPYVYRRSIKSQKRIGFSIFETINPPSEWINYMNGVDTIITATQFNKNIFERAGAKTPITVVPHCFDPKLFNIDVKPKGRFAKTTFLSMGTWRRRKNWESLIKAFYDAFESKDNVCLLVKTDNPQYLQSMVTSVKRHGQWRSKDTAPIYSEEQTNVPFEGVPQLMRKGDIYISSSLGEGFNIPALHAMALGIPVITTRFGGVLEFAKPELCTYIEPSGYQTVETMDGFPQFKKCIWPILKIGDIKSAMLEVWKNYPKEKTANAYKFVHEKYTYDAIGPQMIKAVIDGI